MQKYIKESLHFQHEQLCKAYKGAKTMDKSKIEYHVIHSWLLLFGVATKKTKTKNHFWIV